MYKTNFYPSFRAILSKFFYCLCAWLLFDKFAGSMGINNDFWNVKTKHWYFGMLELLHWCTFEVVNCLLAVSESSTNLLPKHSPLTRNSILWTKMNSIGDTSFFFFLFVILWLAKHFLYVTQKRQCISSSTTALHSYCTQCHYAHH